MFTITWCYFLPFVVENKKSRQTCMSKATHMLLFDLKHDVYISLSWDILNGLMKAKLMRQKEWKLIIRQSVAVLSFWSETKFWSFYLFSNQRWTSLKDICEVKNIWKFLLKSYLVNSAGMLFDSAKHSKKV